MESFLDEALRVARHLVHARGVFMHFPVERATELDLEPVDAVALVVGIVSIGEEIETRVGELMRLGAATRSLFLDAAGSAAVEEAADRLCGMITGDGASGGRMTGHVSCRISPGYGSWPITAQTALFDRVPHKPIGVSLLPTMLMVPRKSISFAMWLGTDARPIAGLSGCARCGLEHCRYRKVNRPAHD